MNTPDAPSTVPSPSPPANGLSAITTWLATPAAARPRDEFSAQRHHLINLSNYRTSPQQRTTLLDAIYKRCVGATSALIPHLIESPRPLPRKLHTTLRCAQDTLQLLARALNDSLNEVEAHLVRGLGHPPELTLWRAAHALGKNFLLSALATAPARRDLWLELHRVYLSALQFGVADAHPSDNPSTVRTMYFTPILLACAQPASLSAREVAFVADYLEHRDKLIDPPSETTPIFWIDPLRDTYAIPSNRRSNAADPLAPLPLAFSCKQLIARLRIQEAALSNGIPARQIELSDFADTLAGRRLLGRLAARWSAPPKRRYPRRRQSYRGHLIDGLDNIAALLRAPSSAPPAASSWIITNESPDGYAVMHVSGATNDLASGNIVALRSETGDNWQICLIRWLQSESQEHIELGLQILSSTATPTTLIPNDQRINNTCDGALLLPAHPPLRAHETLITLNAALPDPPSRFLLLIEQENLIIREMRSTALLDRNERIAVFTIEDDNEPPPPAPAN